MNPNVYRLLDNGWMIGIMRSVDLKYTAYCWRKFTSRDQIFAKFEPDERPDGSMRFKEIHPGKPRQHASADTYEEALELLANQMHAIDEPIV